MSVTDIGAFRVIPPENGGSVAPPIQPTPTFATVNEALVGWLMTAPDAPDERLTLEDWLRRQAWHQRAACRGVGPSDFVRGPKADYEAVRALCGDCPVRLECLDEALADPDLIGLWGGTTELERRDLRRGRVA